MPGRLERWLWACAVALGLGMAGVCAWRVAISPEGMILPRAADAPWIAARAPVTAEIHQWREMAVPVVFFVAGFDGPEAGRDPEPRSGPSPGYPHYPDYELEVRALGDYSVFINNRAVAVATQKDGAPLRDWKRFRSVDVSEFARPGRNAIRVNVRNPHGPGLLSLRLWALSGGTRSLLLASGLGWRAGVDAGDGAAGEPMRAALASDVTPHVTASLGESSLESLWRHGLGIVSCFVLGATAFLVWRRVAAASRGAAWATADALPLLAGAVVAVGWTQLFASKFAGLDIGVGFDAASHVAYADWISEKGSLPRASDGWSMYHPPLFYLVSAAMAAVGEALGASREVALKSVPWLSGLALVVASRSLVRRLMPGESAAEAVAILFAGWLPMNLYLAAYYTNEGFHAALAGFAIAVGIGLLLAREVTPRAIALFSLWIGLALLAKFTAVVVAGVVSTAVAIRIAAGTRAIGPFAIRALWLVAPALLVAGWFYARNIAAYGQPLVGNWSSSELGRIWWSEPGFHTADYYLRFGESLTRPFLASFSSFWDALYSTAWGDGLLAGQGGIRARHGFWNYEWMAAGYLLALPATLLLLLGFGLACRHAVGDPGPARRGAFAVIVALIAAMGLATFWVTLELPYFGQAKAFYSLALVPVASLLFAQAYCALDAWLAERVGSHSRAALFGWLVAFIATVYMGFAA